MEWLLIAGGNTTQVEIVYLGSDDDNELSCVLSESAPDLMLMSVGLSTRFEDSAEEELVPTVCGGIDAMEEEFYSKCHAFDVNSGKWHEYHSLLDPRLKTKIVPHAKTDLLDYQSLLLGVMPLLHCLPKMDG